MKSQLNKFLSYIDIETYSIIKVEDLIREIKVNIQIISIDTDLLFTVLELNHTYKKFNLIKDNIYYYKIRPDHGNEAFFRVKTNTGFFKKSFLKNSLLFRKS